MDHLDHLDGNHSPCVPRYAYRDARAAPAPASGPAPAKVRRSVEVPLDRGRGELLRARLITFDGLLDGAEHFAIGLGAEPQEVPLVRVHSECITGEVLGSVRCDCGPQLDEALHLIDKGGGVLLYLRQEGRGIGLYNKLDAYGLQDGGLDTFEANRALGLGDDLRDYAVAAQMLRALGHTEIDLLTNNPDKLAQLRRYGVDVRRTVGTGVFRTPHNTGYLRAKVAHTSHTIRLEETA
ncbi:GTP cyclohydrolase II [Streptomyces sp. NPDC026672]|uniref:GTP cyclohydrolase II n=1 Tax=unclassified Streptomyces TaxID=2593676 RepID=UPI0033DC7EF8